MVSQVYWKSSGNEDRNGCSAVVSPLLDFTILDAIAPSIFVRSKCKCPVGCHMDSCSGGSHPLIEVPTQTSANPWMEVPRHSENLPNRSARFCNRCALLAPHNSRKGFPSSNRARNIAHSTPSMKTSCGERSARLPSSISNGSTRECGCMGGDDGRASRRRDKTVTLCGTCSH